MKAESPVSQDACPRMELQETTSWILEFVDPIVSIPGLNNHALLNAIYLQGFRKNLHAPHVVTAPSELLQDLPPFYPFIAYKYLPIDHRSIRQHYHSYCIILMKCIYS